MGDQSGRRETPAVSVVVPTHNRVRVLPRTLESALAQQDVELEVVVVDDASTDGTWAYLEGHRDERIRPVRNERNLGVSGSRNRGVEEARGEWIAFLDDDDLWAPSKLSKQLALARLEAADWVYTGHVVLDDRTRAAAIESAVPASEAAMKLKGYNAVGPPSSVIASRDLIERAGRFDERLSYIADWELWIRFAQAGEAALVPEALMGYVQHGESMLLQRRYNVWDEVAYLESKHPEVEVDMLFLSRWLASGPRRAGRRFQAARVYWDGAVAHRNFGNLVRAGGMLLGERIMRVGRSLLGPDRTFEPDWLDPYRQD